MNKIFKNIISFFLLHSALGFSGLTNKEFISDQTLESVKKNNQFALNLYHHLESDQNLFFSPYNISSALLMVYEGARGETQSQMAKVLKFDQSLNTINESFSALQHYFDKASETEYTDFRLSIVNALWIQKGMKVLPQFLNHIAKYFQATVRYVDFYRQREVARILINQFVKEKTMGKIENLIGESDIEKSTKMVLTATIYMKARWQNLFQKELTKTESFFIDPKQKKDTQMMEQIAFFPYFKSDIFSVVELPFIHPKENLPETCFLVILPHDNFGLGEVEKIMDSETFNKVISHLESEEIHLFLPKFSFTKSFSLKNILSAMGMNLAFESDANFEGITGNRELKLGEVLHKAFISIDESGAEASAATAITMNTKAILNKGEPLLFRVDHPFMFMIYEKVTGSILFSGRVLIPDVTN